jgi:hypothetical protein
MDEVTRNLIAKWDMAPEKAHEQAGAIGVSLSRLLSSLSKNVPGFVEYFCEEQGIDLTGERRGASQ